MALAYTVHQEEQESRQVSHLGHNVDHRGKKPGEEGQQRCQSDVPFPVVLGLQDREVHQEVPDQEVP
jgi:hypothetical protein